VKNIKNIGIFSAGRSDLGMLKGIINNLNNSKSARLKIILGPAHFAKIFGRTFRELKELKNKNIKKIKFDLKNSSDKEILYYMSKIILNLKDQDYFRKLDALVLLGDRYETFILSLVALVFKIKIIHLCGGSETEGSIDNIFRKFISECAYINLVETEKHKKNLLNIRNKKKIFNIGSTGLENKNNLLINKKEFERKYKIKFDNEKKIIICVFHPETFKTKKKNIIYLQSILKFLSYKNENIIFTYPNADEGFKDYIKLILLFKKLKKNCFIFKSLGIKNFHSLLSFSDLLIGNSSSGIIESGSFKLPVLNVGDRQKGRVSGKNIIHCKFNFGSLQLAYQKAISNSFVEKIKKIKNIYFKKNSSKKAVKIILKYI
jgi:UDP-hydrolysing UDP-N-acetyl-D-glucosamine 2-epimerase